MEKYVECWFIALNYLVKLLLYHIEIDVIEWAISAVYINLLFHLMLIPFVFKWSGCQILKIPKHRLNDMLDHSNSSLNLTYKLITSELNSSHIKYRWIASIRYFIIWMDSFSGHLKLTYRYARTYPVLIYQSIESTKIKFKKTKNYKTRINHNFCIHIVYIKCIYMNESSVVPMCFFLFPCFTHSMADKFILYLIL